MRKMCPVVLFKAICYPIKIPVGLQFSLNIKALDYHIYEEYRIFCRNILFVVVFNACGASSENLSEDQYKVHTYKSEQGYESADALRQSQGDVGEEQELTDDEKISFGLFVSDYTAAISGILESYYLYKPLLRN